MSARVLIAVTHLLGIGHLVRAGHLARALSQVGYAVTLASGGMRRGGSAQEPFRFEQLPPVLVEGTDFRNLLDEEGKPVTAERLVARRERLEGLAREIAPDVVITEHFPFGRRQIAAEFLGLIAAAKQANPAVLVLSSIRDVLVAPQRADRLADVSQRISSLFDGVLVHGDPAFLPLEASWPVTPEIAARLHYTGYLMEGAEWQSVEAQVENDADISAVGDPRTVIPAAAERSAGIHHRVSSSTMDSGAAPHARLVRNDASGPGEILVSGGGSAAALPLFALAVAAARLMPDRPWRILVGHGVAEADFAALCRGGPANAIIERARQDFQALLAGCAVSISQAGYNTVLDLIRAGRPALCVPFDAGNETEQAIRAEALERAGLARVLRLGEPGFDAQMLAEAVERVLDRPVVPGSHRQAALLPTPALPTASGGRERQAPRLKNSQAIASPVASLAVDLKGASKTVAIVAGLLAGRR